jgi:hypothetical protein
VPSERADECNCGSDTPHLHGEFVKRDGSVTDTYVFSDDEGEAATANS